MLAFTIAWGRRDYSYINVCTADPIVPVATILNPIALISNHGILITTPVDEQVGSGAVRGCGNPVHRAWALLASAGACAKKWGS